MVLALVIPVIIAPVAVPVVSSLLFWLLGVCAMSVTTDASDVIGASAVTEVSVIPSVSSWPSAGVDLAPLFTSTSLS